MSTDGLDVTSGKEVAPSSLLNLPKRAASIAHTNLLGSERGLLEGSLEAERARGVDAGDAAYFFFVEPAFVKHP